VDSPPEVGAEAYDAGAEQLRNFFLKVLKDYNEAGMDPLGRRIVECFRNGGSLGDYEQLLPSD
jgi:hypothetical protein